MKRLLAIVCEVFHREACAAAAQSRLRVDFEFLPKSLHDIGEEAMSARLQATIDHALQTRSADEQPGAIVLLYGLCNNGICGLHAPVPLVVARAHDCITLLLGSRERYEAHFAAHPGTFYKSPGWIERDSDPNDNPASVTSRLGLSRNYAELVEQFGQSRMVHRATLAIGQQVLLADIGDIAGFAVLGEQVVERLFAVRADFLGDGFVPFLAIGEDRVDIKHHAAEIEHAVTHDIADAKARLCAQRGIDLAFGLG